MRRESSRYHKLDERMRGRCEGSTKPRHPESKMMERVQNLVEHNTRGRDSQSVQGRTATPASPQHSDSQRTVSEQFITKRPAKQTHASPPHQRNRPFHLKLQSTISILKITGVDKGESSEIGSSAKKSLNFNLVDSVLDGAQAMLTAPKNAYPETKKKSWYEITLEEEEEEAARISNKQEERANQSMADKERLAVIAEDDDKTMEPDANQLAKGKATVISEETGEEEHDEGEWSQSDDEWKLGEGFYTEEEMMNDDLQMDEVNEMLATDPIYQAVQRTSDTPTTLLLEEPMEEDTAPAPAPAPAPTTYL